MEQKENILVTTWKKKIEDLTFEKIIIELKDERNIIELARSEGRAYDLYKMLLRHDYMFYMHANRKSYFIKRKKLHTIWERNDLQHYKGVFYSQESIYENHLEPKRLLVIFSSMPVESAYFSPNIGIRCFHISDAPAADKLLKNTCVMRIMDANLSHGSCYLNTNNYPLYEDEIQQAIQKVMRENGILKEDVVLYGETKGGTGALYHGFLGDFKVVAVSPVVSLVSWHHLKNDLYYTKDFLSSKLTKKISKVRSPQKFKKIILSSPIAYSDFLTLQNLNKDHVEMHSIFDTNIKDETDIFKNSLIEQITYINQLFLQSNTLSKMKLELEELMKQEFYNRFG
ncbi:XcbB/CpsF family capsular polysaccharide biosynthesis protein [Listeria ilorinensis]|uniref:XcbB/CpsF family capsular polysaccharide biosynthesis protein n=1 Tax=Listeria ilorinensis TaxID=2867439 RepID=UPI001EF57A47|nr:XcbB/CpsF family capsular polysaccharide biosynthesis protein [Listeria ilorinensis]